MKTYRVIIEITSTKGERPDWWLGDLLDANVNMATEAWSYTVEDAPLNTAHLEEINLANRTDA